VCAWAFPLIAWNFSSQKSLSLFLAWPLPLTSPTFFYWIWLAPAKKNWNYESSQKLKILWIDGMPPLWPTDIYEKGRTLSKTYGIKARCDWEHPWGTHWEPIGTNEKWKKSSSFPPLHPPPPFKTPWVQVEPSHWLHETSIPKTFWHRFQPWLIPPL
jgi:hypothetical protein